MIQPGSIIAAIGLDIMQGPISRRLHRRDVRVRCHDLGAQACECAWAQGAHVTGSMAACAAGGRLSIAVLPIPQAGQVVMREMLVSVHQGAIRGHACLPAQRGDPRDCA